MPGRSIALTGFVVLALAAPLVAGGVVVLTQQARSPLESAATPEPLVAKVERASRSRDTMVAISVVREDALAPRTDASGVLTTLAMAAGSAIDTGTVVGSVGEGDLVAYRSPRPLSADVAAGSTGASVTVAQRLLTDLGLYTGAVDGKAGAGTVRAIQNFNSAHDSGRTAVLMLASLVWIGPDPVTVDQPQVRLGDVVGPGTTLFTTRSGLAGVAVATGVVLPEGDLVLEVAGSVAPFGRSLRMATDPTFTSTVAELLGETGEGTGTLRLAEPVDVGTVPTSAVVTDVDGTTCYFPSVDGAPVRVAPAGGSLGTADVDVAMVGHPVLVNPRAVRDDLSCGG